MVPTEGDSQKQKSRLVWCIDGATLGTTVDSDKHPKEQ
jgi:hypothetical protein